MLDELEIKKEYLKRVNNSAHHPVFTTENKEVAYQCMLILGPDFNLTLRSKTYFIKPVYPEFAMDFFLETITEKYEWTRKIHSVIDSMESAITQARIKCAAISEVYNMLASAKSAEDDARISKEEEIRAKFRRY